MHTHARRFVPAAGVDWLLPLYDPMVRLLVREEHVRGRLLEAAEIREGARVLDLGCGTGSLVVMLKRRHPSARVSAIDPDPKALARARAKVESAGVEVAFDQGFADALPYEDRAFDRVISSFMLHHLTGSEKDGALRESFRVLAPGGTLHVLDFTETRGGGFHALAQWLHGGHAAGDDALGTGLAERMRTADFADVAELEQTRTLAGRLSLHRGRRPA
jgi:ubiquinone/menaquinone biosynthesis C-methylase UbiE